MKKEMHSDMEKTVDACCSLTPSVFVPHTEDEYNRIVAMLDSLDEVGEDESHPLASLMEVLAALIQNYETRHVPELTA